MLQEELQELKAAVEYIETSKNAARQAIEAAGKVQRAATDLTRPVEALVERIENVDFPSRLDKLDATVSALGVGLQNLQARLENTERNIKDDMQGLRSSLTTGFENLSSGIKAVRSDINAAERNVKEEMQAVRDRLLARLNDLSTSLDTVQARIEAMEGNIKGEVQGLRKNVATGFDRLSKNVKTVRLLIVLTLLAVCAAVLVPLLGLEISV